MPMDIKELRELRVQLGITQKETAKHLGVPEYYVGSQENCFEQIYQDKKFWTKYEQFLTDVIDGKIDVPRSKQVGKCGGNFGKKRIENPILPQKMVELRAIRQKLGLTIEIVTRHVYLSRTSIGFKETSTVPTSQEEYDRFMKYYKKVKLQRIFGANYKEAEHGGNSKA